MSEAYDAANLARGKAHDALADLERAARADEREELLRAVERVLGPSARRDVEQALVKA